MNTNYVYIIKEREFLKTNENIYKLGRTAQNGLKRFNSYPKGSELIILRKCVDCKKYERELILLFKNKFILRKDIGREYFEAEEDEIVNEFNDYFSNCQPKKKGISNRALNLKPKKKLQKIKKIKNIKKCKQIFNLSVKNTNKLSQKIPIKKNILPDLEDISDNEYSDKDLDTFLSKENILLHSEDLRLKMFLNKLLVIDLKTFLIKMKMTVPRNKNEIINNILSTKKNINCILNILTISDLKKICQRLNIKTKSRFKKNDYINVLTQINK